MPDSFDPFLWEDVTSLAARSPYNAGDSNAVNDAVRAIKSVFMPTPDAYLIAQALRYNLTYDPSQTLLEYNYREGSAADQINSGLVLAAFGASYLVHQPVAMGRFLYGHAALEQERALRQEPSFYHDDIDGFGPRFFCDRFAQNGVDAAGIFAQIDALNSAAAPDKKAVAKVHPATKTYMLIKQAYVLHQQTAALEAIAQADRDAISPKLSEQIQQDRNYAKTITRYGAALQKQADPLLQGMFQDMCKAYQNVTTRLIDNKLIPR